jgi:hypothetical protein
MSNETPARYSFFVDVGKVPPNEVEAFLRKVKKRLKGKKFNNPMNGDDDTFHDK